VLNVNSIKYQRNFVAKKQGHKRNDTQDCFRIEMQKSLRSNARIRRRKKSWICCWRPSLCVKQKYGDI